MPASAAATAAGTRRRQARQQSHNQQRGGDHRLDHRNRESGHAGQCADDQHRDESERRQPGRSHHQRAPQAHGQHGCQVVKPGEGVREAVQKAGGMGVRVGTGVRQGQCRAQRECCAEDELEKVCYGFHSGSTSVDGGYRRF